MSKPLVSVIINCLNGQEFLKKAIDSILYQSYQNWELIFWDNNSVDKTKEIVNSYNDNRIKYYLSEKTYPLGQARNLAITKTKGDFLTFLDCDDWWELNRLENIIDKFTDNKVGVVYSNGYVFNQESDKYRCFYYLKPKEGWLFKSLIARYNIYMPSTIFRKEALEGLDYIFNPNFSMIEEAELIIRLAKTWKIAYVDKKLCYWRAHKNSLSWVKQDNFAKENTVLINYLESNYPYLSKDKCLNKFKARNSYRIFLANWKKGILKREVIFPYLLIDTRLIAFYLLSFLPLKITMIILRIVGKEI